MAVWAFCVLVLALLGVSGCGGGDAESTSTPVCGESDVQSITLTTEDGVELDGALVGDGEVGVVLGHELRSDYCSWLPFAKKLADHEVRALAINFASASASPDDDMVAGARELEERGVEQIKLAGASMGGTAALAAGAEIDTAGVASLSGPREFGGLDALPAVSRLDVPVLLLAAKQDAGYVDDARALYRATKSPDKELVITDGFEHGTDLLEDPKAESALLDFLAGDA